MSEPVIEPRAFDELYPIGSKFIYMSVAGTRGGKIVKTRSCAWALGCGEIVVMIEGRTGGVAVSHLTPLEE